MRLTESTVDAIIELARKHFHDDVDIYLFGSRVDDSKHGGDIDLYIASSSVSEPVRSKLAFKVALCNIIGEQKVDVVFHDKNLMLKPIHEIALSEGIKLT
ncbi:nucleotidyltransferase domain-containing protein [Shewanella sp. 202IG2-18]|uniref:nucleotidyltransferase domain-containing protein n=1 Tax=Parashewanella hymeniacidonis TaxID=2807618 RepID=UPI001961417A|nr:nucleotidyltransferase domain-containing protein [Parashewanella hymeniacidonis]MBM7072118.1 nucleotidyltransferase domain-containing protein [Parashewanella hymeniacidonis]